MNRMFFKAFLLSALAAIFFVACDIPPSNTGGCPEYESSARTAAPSLAKPATSCLPPPWHPWKRSPPAEYTFIYERAACECLPEDTGPFHVRVSQGVVTSVLRGGPQSDMVAVIERVQSYALDSIWQTVNRYLSQSYHRADVRYDSMWGFPDSFFVDPVANMADEEYGMTITGFTVLQE